jgi:PTH2 family peptidyl-tRNA hydrolase
MVKQVILLRTDLNMRKGKMAAQTAHASLKVFFDRKMPSSSRCSIGAEDQGAASSNTLIVPLTIEMDEWVNGVFAKIVLGVASEVDLLEAYRLALEAGLPTSLIVDIGNTEFHGVPTNTAVAIGPARSEDIDKITGPTGLVATKLL